MDLGNDTKYFNWGAGKHSRTGTSYYKKKTMGRNWCCQEERKTSWQTAYHPTGWFRGSVLSMESREDNSQRSYADAKNEKQYLLPNGKSVRREKYVKRYVRIETYPKIRKLPCGTVENKALSVCHKVEVLGENKFYL